MGPALIVQGLARRYGAVKAVDGISFEVGAGEVFGLLGPNGAGKTTTLECILGLVRPDAGRIEIEGDADSARARAKVGAVLQATGLPDKITPREALTVFGAFYPAPPISRYAPALRRRRGSARECGAGTESRSASAPRAAVSVSGVRGNSAPARGFVPAPETIE